MHDAYLWVKFLHQLAAVAWLGWLLLAPAWLGHALAAVDAPSLARARRRVTGLAVACVGIGGTVAGMTGWPMANTLSPEAFGLYWLKTGTAVFIVASVLWLAGVLPMYRHLLVLRERTGAHPRKQAAVFWAGVAAAAVLGLSVLWMMTVRPV